MNEDAATLVMGCWVVASIGQGRPRFIPLDAKVPKAHYSTMKVLAFLVCLFFMGAIPAQAKAEQQGDVARYGPYPTNYKEIVTKWLETQLLDPNSARIEWTEEPKPADLGKDGQHLYGYLVHFNVNARNRFGAFTGKQKHGVLIRNGEVIKGLGFGY